jgi:hypothetical protein
MATMIGRFSRNFFSGTAEGIELKSGIYVLNLLLMSNPSNLNKVCTLPPIGLADHDIVYAEIDTWLKRVRETPRKV